jgi:hypothetical protein
MSLLILFFDRAARFAEQLINNAPAHQRLKKSEERNKQRDPAVLPNRINEQKDCDDQTEHSSCRINILFKHHFPFPFGRQAIIKSPFSFIRFCYTIFSIKTGILLAHFF